MDSLRKDLEDYEEIRQLPEVKASLAAKRKQEQDLEPV